MITHPELVRSLIKPGRVMVEEATDLSMHLNHMAMCIAGEAGEIIDCVKKYTIYNKPLDMDNLIEELGDMEFYLEGLRQALSINRETTIVHNINKLSKRYEGIKYSDKAAQERKDKV